MFTYYLFLRVPYLCLCLVCVRTLSFTLLFKHVNCIYCVSILQEKTENGINDMNEKHKEIMSFSRRVAMRYGGWAVEDTAAKDPAILKSHRATDWQNVALIWDKFMMIIMTLMTGIALAIVFFLYVAEINRNEIDFGGDDDGMAVEANVNKWITEKGLLAMA